MFDKYDGVRGNKGVVLFIVIANVFIVALLASIILIVMKNNSRLSQSKINRIKAYYGAYAAIVYAFDRLGTNGAGAWTAGNYAICPAAGAGCTVVESDIPFRVDINIGALGSGIAGTRSIVATANYTTESLE